jgi:transcriptional regulator with XRE-family HTH domain
MSELIDPSDLGGKLKALRVRQRLTQVALAKQSLLSPIFIAKVEAGERMPSWETLARLTDRLGVEVRVALVQRRKGRQ